MQTLSKTLEEQKDLERLISNVANPSFERHTPNNLYGSAYAIKKYADYPMDKPIKATFPHGIYHYDGVISIQESKFDLPAALNFPNFTRSLWKEHAPNKRIIPFASPILYNIALWENEVPQSERKGTMLLPKHDTKHVGIDIDHDALCKEANEIPDELKPVTICLFYRDIEKGLHKKYEKHGFNVVCAGNPMDPMYSIRWLHLASQHKAVAHCGLGSAIYYSVAAGIPFFFTKLDYVRQEHSKDVRMFIGNTDHPITPEGFERIEKVKSLFSKPSDFITQEQKEFVDLILNTDHFMSPEELHSLLYWIEDL